MTPQLGDTAPDFEAETTRGPIRFHEWLGGSRGVLFSRPADFAPVCTTELGAVARLKGEFGRRGTEVMGLDRGHPAVRHAANPTNSPHRGHGGEGAAPAWARRQRN